MEHFALVALLSTVGSWDATATTTGSDRAAMELLGREGTQRWNLSRLIKSSSLQRAIRSLDERVPVCNVFHTNLLCDFALTNEGTTLAFAKVWSVRKPQNTVFLTARDLADLTS